MMKTIYVKPQTEVLHAEAEAALLLTSAETYKLDIYTDDPQDPGYAFGRLLFE